MKPTWPTKKLGEVAKVIVGKTPAKVDYLDVGKHKVLKYRDITKSGIVWNINDKGFVKETALKGMKEIEIGDLLITSAGHSSEKIGEESVIINNLPSQFEKVYFASELICFRANQKMLSPYWLLFYLYSDTGQDQLKKIIGDSVHLTKEKSQNLQFPLPPLHIQKQIVAKIEELFEKVDKAIELRKKALEETTQIFPAALQEIFGKTGKKWKTKRLGDPNVAEVIMGQSPPSSTYNDHSEGLPFYQGKVDFSEIYPTPQKWCSKPKKIALKDDVLISVRAPVGPTNICREKSCIGRGLSAIRCKENLDNFFLFYWFRYKEPEIANLGQGSTFGAIKKNYLEKLLLPLLPLPEQKRIVSYLDGVREKVEKLKKYQESQLKDLEELKQSILTRAFKGELLK